MITAKRINVVGTSGSGKSTFAQRLAERMQVPYVELDELNWQPNWTEAVDEVLFSRLEDALQGDAWVLDGNYKKTIPVKWRRVEMIVWLDMPFWLTFYQVLVRTFRRSLRNEELWAGNRESLSKAFFSRDSILLWSLSTYRENRRKYLQLMASNDYPHIQFVQIRSRAEQEAFLLQVNTGGA